MVVIMKKLLEKNIKCRCEKSKVINVKMIDLCVIILKVFVLLLFM